jgi:hypothetical protein
MAEVRTLSDGRTIMASCSTGGCIQAGGSLGLCNVFDRYVTAQNEGNKQGARCHADLLAVHCF